MLFFDEAQSALKVSREKEKSRSSGAKSERRKTKLEVVCLTPATSFDFGFPEGKKEERQFLHALIFAVFQKRGLKGDLLRKAATSFFTPPAKTDHWGWRNAVKQKLNDEVAWILVNRPEVTERLMARLALPFLDAAMLESEKSVDRRTYGKLKIDSRTAVTSRKHLSMNVARKTTQVKIFFGTKFAALSILHFGPSFL